jgi:hypothetical protein
MWAACRELAGLEGPDLRPRQADRFGDRADLALGELLEDRVRTSLRTDAPDMLGSMAGDGA